MPIAARKQIRPIEAYALVLLVIVTTELVVMELFGPLLSQFNPLFAALLDATLLLILSYVPLWLIYFPVLTRRMQRDDAAFRGLRLAFLKSMAVFFLVELVVMLCLPLLLPGESLVSLAFADAGMTAMLSALPLWWLLIRLERAHHQVLMADLLESPLLLYILLIYMIFIAGLLKALLVASDVSLPDDAIYHIVDALVLTLIISPFLWLFVARPLRRSLQTERTRARAVYEQVIDAVLLTNSQGMITSLNPAAQKIFGYPEAELLGLPLGVLFADQRSAEHLLQAVAADDAGKAGVFREMSGRHHYGSLLIMDVSISRIFMGGSEGYLLIMRDIGERKEAERALHESDVRFRQIYEQSEDAILFCKPGSDYIVDINHTTERLFGYGRGDMQGHGLELLFQGDCLARVQTTLATLKEGGAIQLDNLAGLRRDQSEVIVTLRAKVMILQGVELICCTLHDVTDRVRMDQESRDIQARLIQANKMTSLGLMVSGVAHEINNPNNFIMANAQILAGCWEDTRKVLREYYRENGDFFLGGIAFSELEDQSPQLLSEILDGSRRINQIVSNLKQFVRPERDNREGEVDVNQVVSSTINILQHELMRHTDNFHCKLSDNLPRVIGNSQQISQVVLNLLLNACQALPARHHGIQVSTGVESATGQITITVHDEGCGISSETGRQIMEPFFTTKLDHGGTGLGLWICRSIVAEHKGTLEFVSIPGAGSTFTVKIPAATAAA